MKMYAFTSDKNTRDNLINIQYFCRVVRNNFMWTRNGYDYGPKKQRKKIEENLRKSSSDRLKS